MADSAAAKGIGFWPKVAIWAAVIAVGALYLESVNHKAAKDERSAPIIDPRGAPPLVAPEESRGQVSTALVPSPVVPAGDAGVGGVGEDESPAMAADDEPPTAEPESAPSDATREPPPAELAAKPLEEVSPAEAEAFARAVLSEPGQAEREEAPAAEPAPPPEPDLEQQRARVVAEYEAMRKRAEEDMRRRWPGTPMVPVMPYAAPQVRGFFPPPPHPWPPAYYDPTR